jgi:hypothetical protein
VTTLGISTECSVPTAGSGPFSIAAGPDGNLWFIERTGNKVGKITIAPGPPIGVAQVPGLARGVPPVVPQSSPATRFAAGRQALGGYRPQRSEAAIVKHLGGILAGTKALTDLLEADSIPEPQGDWVLGLLGGAAGAFCTLPQNHSAAMIERGLLATRLAR